MALSPDGLRMLTVDADIVLRLWDAHSGQELRLLVGHTESISSVAFSPHGAQAISGGGRYRGHDFIVRLWTVDGGKEEKQMQGHTAEVTSVAFLPDGKYAVSGSCDKTIRLWDLATAKEVRRFEGHTLSVRDIALSADGQRLISGGAGPYPALCGISKPASSYIVSRDMKERSRAWPSLRMGGTFSQEARITRCVCGTRRLARKYGPSRVIPG